MEQQQNAEAEAAKIAAQIVPEKPPRSQFWVEAAKIVEKLMNTIEEHNEK